MTYSSPHTSDQRETVQTTDIAERPSDYKIHQIIGASAVGTMIEWYDFYIFGSLATVISPLFYPSGNETLALIAYLSRSEERRVGKECRTGLSAWPLRNKEKS